MAVVCVLGLVCGRSVRAQAIPALAGVVVDDVDAVLPGARITIRSDDGRVVQASTTRADGAFAFEHLEPGGYAVAAELPLFVPALVRVTIPTSADAPVLRIVLRPGGFSEDVVVTGRRIASRLADTPQKIEVVDATDIERTIAADLTDLLKKNAGVDVIQYSGVLSGIGIRGFRPQFSGINKRSLLLIDGRPAGATNLGTVRLDGFDRVEILKGAASATYGSSAMGGVVNLISRESRGALRGMARLGGGSYGTSDVGGHLGGSAGKRVDFDLGGTLFNQRDDYRMGNGVVRPATRYRTYDGSARVGVDLGAWRIQGRADGYRGRDIMTPGDLASGLNAQGQKDLERSTRDVRASGLLSTHAVSLTAYQAGESSQTTNVTTTNPLDRPFLPYLSFESDIHWKGLQARDAWDWSAAGSLVAGVDYEHVTSVSRSYARTGDRIAPVLGRQQQAHGRGLCGEHAETVARAGRRRGRRTVRFHHHRNGGHAAQDELPAVRKQLQRLQPQPGPEGGRRARRARPRRRGSGLHPG